MWTKDIISVSEMWDGYVESLLSKELCISCPEFLENKKTFYVAVGLTLLAIKNTGTSKTLSDEEGSMAVRDILIQCTEFLKKWKQDHQDQESESK